MSCCPLHVSVLESLNNVYGIAALWIAVAFAASAMSPRLGLSVALVEILLGVFGGNVLGMAHQYDEAIQHFRRASQINPTEASIHYDLGSLLMESFFGIPGLGSYTIDAIQAQDFAVVRSMVFIGSLLYIAGLILTDISYTLVDPRIRLA